MVMRIAILNNQIVENIIEANEDFAKNLNKDYVILKDSDRPDIGATYDGTTFINPILTPPPIDYRKARMTEYPPIGDQLDVILKQINQDRLNGKPMIQEMDDLLGTWLAVKDKYPKPGV